MNNLCIKSDLWILIQTDIMLDKVVQFTGEAVSSSLIYNFNRNIFVLKFTTTSLGRPQCHRKTQPQPEHLQAILKVRDLNNQSSFRQFVRFESNVRVLAYFTLYSRRLYTHLLLLQR